MMKVEFTRKDIESVYDEIDRRIECDQRDGSFRWESELIDTRQTMLQGVYSTLLTVAVNWSDVRFWTDQIEEARYGNDPQQREV